MNRINVLKTVASAFAIVLVTLYQGCSIGSSTPTKEADKGFDVQIQLAERYYEKFDYDNALVHYKKALEIQPENPGIHYSIGMIYGFKHSAENPGQSIIGGRESQLSGIVRHPDSNYQQAVKYLRKAAELGHLEAREILRAMHDNIQRFDVKY